MDDFISESDDFLLYIGVCVFLSIIDARTQAEDTVVPDDCLCNRIYAPVCGTDYVTYENTCEFECSKLKNPELSIIGDRGEPCEDLNSKSHYLFLS